MDGFVLEVVIGGQVTDGACFRPHQDRMCNGLAAAHFDAFQQRAVANSRGDK